MQLMWILYCLKDTVVALEALVKYSMQNNDVNDLDLTVEMCLQDGRKDVVRLRKQNALIQPAIKVKVTFICPYMEV